MDKLRVGVVGVGHLGRIHTRIYSELSEWVDLVGVYDQNPSQMKAVAQEYGTGSFERLEELLASVDALSCAVPTSYHYPVAKQAAESGCHVLIEKPITDKVDTAQELVHLFDQKGLTLMVGHTERFNPAMEICHHLEFKPKFIEAHRLAQFNPRGTDVAVIFDLMIHDVDIILKITGAYPESIDAVGVPVITPLIDIANVRLRFPSGCVANLTASRISLNKMRKIRVFQENSYISMDFLEKKSDQVSLNDQARIQKHDLYTQGFSLTDFQFHQYKNSNEPLKSEIADFIESIRQARPPAVTGQDGLNALRVCATIEESICQNLAHYQ